MALETGSIAFIGFNADASDGFAFIAIDAIAAGAVIRFSDNEWNGLPLGAGGAFNTGEGGLTWTNTGADIAVGTVIELLNTSVPATRSASLGVISGGSLALGNSDESIFAFVGDSETTATTFLAAVTNANGGFIGATSSGLLAGTGLVVGETALVLPRTDGADVASFDPALGGSTFVSRSQALAAFNATANWVAQSGTGDQSIDDVTPDAPFLSDALSPIAGVTFSIGAAAAVSVANLLVDDAAKPEGDAFQFTVTLSEVVSVDTVVALSASGATGDLVAVPGTVTVLAGQSSASFSIASIEDTALESDEAFTITATLDASSQQATATIENDDVAPITVIGGIVILDQAASLQGSIATPVATNSLNLTRVGAVISGNGVGGAESIAFDASNDRAFVTNPALDRIDILDLSNPRLPNKIGFIDLAATLSGFNYGNVNSVATRNGLVAVAVQNADGGANGLVAFYDGNTGALIKTLEVGVLPDQITFSPDGTLLTVANEGERYLDLSGPATIDDASGSISIIYVPANAADAVVRNTIGFTTLNDFEAQLDTLGLRTLDATSISVTSGGLTGTLAIPDATVSQDIEPEYVAISADGTRAYVTLQEVNAVAVIDLTDATADRPISILPLGFVDFSLPGNEADFSDRDGPSNSASISVGNGPIKGLLQPDAIASFDVGGVTYFITANEGDSRIVSSPTFDDPALNEVRASTLTNPDDPDYARLLVDTVWSTPTDLYAFGGRGFSIFRQNADGTIVKVDETGGDIEQIIAALPNAAAVFNGQNGGEFDTRSDNKGAEPEGVAVGVVDGVPYAFVALERIGGVMVWDLSNPEDAKFVRYMAPTSQDYGPEVIRFVSAAESPNGRALVLTANELTGSVTVYEASPLTTISEIQGTSAASTRVGQTVTVEAIVVGDFQNGDADTARNLGGFFLQEEVFDQDGNPLSSEGIFIAQGALGTDVQLGDRVRVTGSVAESFGNTEINATSITVVEAGAVADVNALAVAVDLPTLGVQGANGVYRADLEAYEGMLVTFPEKLTITEQFNLDQFGEIRLTQGERPSSFTVNNEPDAAGFDTHLRDIASRSVLFDDGRSISNPNLANTVVDGPYTTANAPRMGDTVVGLTGVLDYDFGQFRVQAIANGIGINDFVSENPRPTEPPDVGGTLKIASFNVLNYFTTLDNGALTANGFEPRGAETSAEFERQTNKLVNTILTLDADVLGLMELENNFTEGASGNAIAYLVDQLNTVAGSFKFDWVRPGQAFVGGDAIAVGFVYDVTSVKVSFGSTVAILDDSDVSPDLLAQSSIGQIFNGANTSRAALAVTFQEISTGGEFTAVANHFKSKGGVGIGEDADARDGAGAFNNQRTLAAQALLDWLDTNPTGSTDDDIVILGDLNSYNREDPIDVLTDAGYVDQGAGSYGYVFDGQTGSLDHVLTNAGLSSQVTGVADWHINADEADALDYQLNFNADLTTNERDPSYFAANVAARVSDHDPIVVGLDLKEGPIFKLQILHAYAESGLLATDTAPITGALIDKFEDSYNTLVVTEGDSFIPGPFLIAGADPALNAVPGIGSTALGRPDIAIMNALGVDAAALGNHEFDLGSPVLQGAIQSSGAWVGAQFPLITANLSFAADASLRPLADASIGGAAANAFAGQDVTAIRGRIAPYAFATVGGEKIGLIGATTYDLLSRTSPNGTRPLDDNDPSTSDLQEVANYLQTAIDALRAQGINKIVMLDQLDDLQRNRDLAPLLSGVDVMVAGGGHERQGDATDTAVAFNGHDANFVENYPIVTAGKDGKTTLIVTTDTEYTYLGRLVLDFDSNGEIILSSLDPVINGAYAATEASLQAAYGSTQTAAEIVASSTIGSKVKAITDAIDAIAIAKDSTIYGYTNVYLEGDRVFSRTQEVNLGDITADANIFKAQQALGDLPYLVSLKNGGGIRASIGSVNADGDKIPPIANPDANKPAGAISQLDVENALRFDNRLMVFDTTAQGLLNILNYAAGLSSGPANQNGGYAQVGGVRFSYDPTAPLGQRVRDVALVDDDGTSTALVDDGVILPGAPAVISVVSLNFTVGSNAGIDATGGDGYPIKSNGTNFRYLYTDGTVSAEVSEVLDFDDAATIAAFSTGGKTILGEQRAFADFLSAVHGTPATAFNSADTPSSLDERIQNLNFRADTVLADVNDDPVVVFDDLVPVLATNALFATLGSDDLLTTDAEGGALVYTVTSLAAGNLLVNGEIADIGTTFTQDDIASGRVTLLAGAVVAPASPVSDSFGFSVSDGVNVVSGNFKANYEAFDAVGGVIRFGGLFGGNGDDYLIGTAGVANTLAGGNRGDDTLIGRGEADKLVGGDGNNRLFGGAGNDQIGALGGNDLLDGGDGDDTISTGNGNNIVFGGTGNDSINAGMGDDIIFGGDGNDTIYSSGGNDAVNGGAGDDYIVLHGQNDVVIAGTGNDVVFAFDGANTYQLGGISGALSDGNDRFQGVSGADSYLLFLSDRTGAAAGFGDDTIIGFNLAQGDRLVAFNETAGFWDDPAALLSLAQSGFISGERTLVSNDLRLTFAAGEAQQSSLLLRGFFGANSASLSPAENAIPRGALSATSLALVLDDIIQDGGSLGISGSDFIVKAHDYIADDFRL